MSRYGPTPPYPEPLTISVIGKRVQLKNIIGNMILGKEAFTQTSQEIFVTEHNSFKVIIAPDFFDEENLYPDQQLIDFMAVSYPGPHLFLLAIDSVNNQQDKVLAQVSKLQDVFGDRVTEHLAIIPPDVESYTSLSQTLKDHFRIWLANHESLARDCRNACSRSQPYLFDFKNYSQQVVERRKAALEGRFAAQSVVYRGREDAGPINAPLQQRAAAADLTPVAAATPAQPEIQQNKEKSFNIILLGLSGTGKSASANTILLAGDPDLKPSQLFKSNAESVSVTTECSFKVLEKHFTVPIYVVDTPDFFNDAVEDRQQQLAECRSFCQPGQFVVLLVMQLGRITDSEKNILEKLENLLGFRIRESTIVLFTHKEDLKASLKDYVENSVNLRATVAQCGWRYTAFSNTTKISRQVVELFKMIKACNTNFPKSSWKFDCQVN